MQSEPTTVEKLRGLPWSIAANAANTVMVQYTFFGSVFVLFLSALGLSKSEMGFTLSLVPYSGLVALFVAPVVARVGVKRAYMLSFGARAIVAGGLLFTPWALRLYGPQATLSFVAIITGTFALVRSVGVTASFPWVQEYVPNSVRGKYTATSNIFTTVTGFVAVAAGGWVLNNTVGLSGFMILISVGAVFGLISVGLSAKIPGGAPRRVPSGQRGPKRDLRAAVGDRNFVMYLMGVGLITLVTVPLGSFLPLFMREQVGLNDSAVVWLQTGTLAGTLLSSYLWGWAADRYGSLPVTLYGLGLRGLLPLLWMLMPRESAASLPAAWGIALLQGVADMGWGIGSGRMLYVNIVPPDKRTDYLALYYTFTSIVGGTSQLFGGRVLDMSRNLSGDFWFFKLDPYVPLFLAAIAGPFLAFYLLRAVRAERGVGVGEFAGIFLRGNPFVAMSSMIRYHLARDEHSTVLMTEQLGQAKSPLTVDELLEALEDPRFNVRFEAIISIARMPSDPRLLEALVEILEGTELALTVVAAWALGRLGAPEAIGPLTRALDSEYRSVRAHSARALGALGANEVAPLLLQRLETETDMGLQMAYASALGNLQAIEATPQLLALMDHTDNPGARLELALTLARIVGNEHHFISLLRAARGDPGTTLAQAVASVRRRVGKGKSTSQTAAWDRCENALAREDLAQGSRLLGDLLAEILPADPETATYRILETCRGKLAEGHSESLEYVLLALHATETGRHS